MSISFPKRSSKELESDRLRAAHDLEHGRLVQHLMDDNHFTEVIIVGVNDRNEYKVMCHADTDTDLKFCQEKSAAITAALRKLGLTLNTTRDKE